MQKVKLGNSDLEITPVGVGAWAIGGPWEWGWGPQDDEVSKKTIHAALDAGINWIDTAPVYGLGHSETIVGEVCKQRAEKPLIFSKCSLVWDAEQNVSGVLKRESVIKEVEDSLRRLQVEVIDLFQIHWPNPDEDIEEGWQAVVDLKQQGKIRWGGVSNFQVDQLKRIAPTSIPTSLQPPYNLLNPGIEKEILPYCQENNMGVIVYSPMGSGLLTGAMTRERINTLDQSDWRHRNPDFAEPRLTRNLQLVELLSEIASKYSATPGEVAIAWTLHNPAVTGAIVGVRKPEQVDGIIKGGVIKLELDDVEALRNFITTNP